jgi:hypothetical protein
MSRAVVVTVNEAARALPPFASVAPPVAEREPFGAMVTVPVVVPAASFPNPRS